LIKSLKLDNAKRQRDKVATGPSPVAPSTLAATRLGRPLVPVVWFLRLSTRTPATHDRQRNSGDEDRDDQHSHRNRQQLATSYTHRRGLLRI